MADAIDHEADQWRYLRGGDATHHVCFTSPELDGHDPFVKAAIVFMQGCSCARPGTPQDCRECTDAYVSCLKRLLGRE